jgi:hypothetical protein
VSLPNRVADPHHFNADPDLAFHFNADPHHFNEDPDPAFRFNADPHHFNADPDPAFHFNADPYSAPLKTVMEICVYWSKDPLGLHFFSL